MIRTRVAVIVAAPPHEVWDDLAHIEAHVEWMADARSLDFVSDTTSGIGTRFDCLTVVGPMRMTDRMEITRWDAPVEMGVHHSGVVTGTGRFVLTATADDEMTILTWTEDLAFPWWLAGPLGEQIARPVLRRVWMGNLRRFAARFDR